SLNVIAFSDYRIQDIYRLIECVAENKPDLVLYAGDDLGRFHSPDENLFEEIARHAKYGVCAVAGNDDADAKGYLTGKSVTAVHRCAAVIGSFAVVGLEGAPFFPPGSGENMNMGPLLYSDVLAGCQTKTWDFFGDKNLIIVSHAPPFGTLDRAIRFGVRSIGSKPLREYLTRSTNAILCVCGHVHSCGGEMERVGGGTVVDAGATDR